MEGVGPIQALTDVVGIHLLVPEKTELFVSHGKTVEKVAVKFRAMSEFPVALVSSPKKPDPDPEKGQPVKHFAHLYYLGETNRKDMVLPVSRCDGLNAAREIKAANIFCPGGEGEGEDDGG